MRKTLGSDSYVYVEVGSDMPLIVRQNGTSTKQLGETVHLSPIGNLRSTASTPPASRWPTGDVGGPILLGPRPSRRELSLDRPLAP